MVKTRVLNFVKVGDRLRLEQTMEGNWKKGQSQHDFLMSLGHFKESITDKGRYITSYKNLVEGPITDAQREKYGYNKHTYLEDNRDRRSGDEGGGLEINNLIGGRLTAPITTDENGNIIYVGLDRVTNDKEIIDTIVTIWHKTISYDVSCDLNGKVIETTIDEDPVSFVRVDEDRLGFVAMDNELSGQVLEFINRVSREPRVVFEHLLKEDIRVDGKKEDRFDAGQSVSHMQYIQKLNRKISLSFDINYLAPVISDGLFDENVSSGHENGQYRGVEYKADTYRDYDARLQEEYRAEGIKGLDEKFECKESGSRQEEDGFGGDEPPKISVPRPKNKKKRKSRKPIPKNNRVEEGSMHINPVQAESYLTTYVALRAVENMIGKKDQQMESAMDVEDVRLDGGYDSIPKDHVDDDGVNIGNEDGTVNNSIFGHSQVFVENKHQVVDKDIEAPLRQMRDREARVYRPITVIRKERKDKKKTLLVANARGLIKKKTKSTNTLELIVIKDVKKIKTCKIKKITDYQKLVKKLKTIIIKRG